MGVEQAKVEMMRALIERGFLIPSGVRGLNGRGAKMIHLVAGITSAIDRLSNGEEAIAVSFPPLIPRELLRRVGYVDNFPQLCGSIHSFAGKERDHLAFADTARAGGDWGPHLSQTELVLLPAACYPLYPALTGTLPEAGARYDFTGHCYRNEPSDDPARMQYFEVREKVCAGTPELAQSWRASWRDRGLELLRALQLPVNAELATDPFFGRAGRLMKANQQDQALKFELQVAVWSESEPTAVASFNYHQEYFGKTFDIRTAAGEVAHTSCLGFGIDRIAVALLKIHGLELERWPAEVRAKLWV